MVVIESAAIQIHEFLRGVDYLIQATYQYLAEQNQLSQVNF
jgi:hypothetical protein